MKSIRESLKGVGNALWLGPLFKWLEAVLELLVPLITAGIIDVGVANRDASYVLSRGVLMVFLAVLGALFALICQYYAAKVSAKFGKQMRSRVFSHAMGLSQAQVEKLGRERLSVGITNDVHQIQAALNMLLRLGTRVPFLTAGAILMAGVLNVYAGLVYGLATLFICFALVLIMRKTLGKYAYIQQGQDDLFRKALENLEGVRVIRAFSKQNQEQRAFDESAQGLGRILIHTGRISALMNPAAGVVANLAIVAVVWFGANAVNLGQMLTGDIIALVNYMMQILVGLLMATNLLVLFTRAMASAKRVEALLEEKPEIVDGSGAEMQEDAPAFSFSKVGFRYDDGAENAVSDIDLLAWPGQNVGIIGGTGSGKSTLIHLLVRHYDATQGVVAVFGEDVRDYALQPLRSCFGMVMQGARLFSKSIRENLLMAAPQAQEEQLWQALQAAQAADFVREKPEGLDSVLQEGGGGLSGGQRQRLLIARALLRKPRILVLDDAASALDYATEAALRESLKTWKTEAGASLTTLTVSQRVASIRACDAVYVMEEGRVVASGTHDTLLKTSELYLEICQSQGVCS